MKHRRNTPAIRITLACVSAFLLIPALSSQSIEEYFSAPGLSINAYHVNFYDGTFSNSYTFYQKAFRCDLEVLVYVHNTEPTEQILYVDDRKVYTVNDCSLQLLYDFGLEPGEKMPVGSHYSSYVLEQTYPVTLLNGEVRTAYKFDRTVWIEGIGDIKYSLVPKRSIEGSDVFVCAKLGDEILWMDPSQQTECAELSCVIPKISVNTEIDEFTLRVENNTIFADSFKWDFGDGNTSTVTDPVHHYDSPGCYLLSLSPSSDCHDDTPVHIATVPICIGDSWTLDIGIDFLDYFNVYRYSDEIEFVWRGTQLYRTTDGGQSWTLLEIPLPPDPVRRTIRDVQMYDPMRGIILCHNSGAQAGQYQGILVTADGGMSWQEKAPGSYFMMSQVLANDGRAWVLGTTNRYFITQNYGITWERIELPVLFTLRSIQHIHDSFLIASAFTGIQPNVTYHVAKSFDNGLTWETTDLAEPFNSWHFFDELHAYGRQGSILLETIDGGVTWHEIALPFDVKSFAFHSPDTGWIVDIYNLVHYTMDGMQSLALSNCGGENLKRIGIVSGTEAYGLFVKPPGSPKPGNLKKVFGVPDDVDCAPSSTDELANHKITIFPNPASDILHLSAPFDPETMEVRVFDMASKLVLTSVGSASTDIRALPQGIYVVEIRDSANSYRSAGKIVIVR